jgi:hypothetical protein
MATDSTVALTQMISRLVAPGAATRRIAETKVDRHGRGVMGGTIMDAINDDRSVTVLGRAPRGPPPDGDHRSVRRRGRERRTGPFRGAAGTTPGRAARAQPEIHARRSQP